VNSPQNEAISVFGEPPPQSTHDLIANLNFVPAYLTKAKGAFNLNPHWKVVLAARIGLRSEGPTLVPENWLCIPLKPATQSGRRGEYQDGTNQFSPGSVIGVIIGYFLCSWEVNQC
jgi:hypothetical protein